MAIPESTIQRAAEALYARDHIVPEPDGLKERVIEMYQQDILTALPILRDAIRAEISNELNAYLIASDGSVHPEYTNGIADAILVVQDMNL